MNNKHQIIIEFPSKKLGDEFASQMSDGFGEGLCNFSSWRQKPNTDGKQASDFESAYDEVGRRIYFVKSITQF